MEKIMDNFLEIVKIVSGSIYVLYIPGFCLSYIFLKKGSVDVIERTAVSFALSISVVPLLVFYLNLVGIKISTLSIIFEVLGIIVFSIAYLYYVNIYRKKYDAKK